MLHEEQMEEKRKKDRKRFRLQKWNVRRQRYVKLIGRGSERGSAVLRKQGLKLLGRENIPGALSKAPPYNPGILHFLSHVRFTHNTRLLCCTCHCFSLFKYLIVRTPYASVL